MRTHAVINSIATSPDSTPMQIAQLSSSLETIHMQQQEIQQCLAELQQIQTKSQQQKNRTKHCFVHGQNNSHWRTTCKVMNNPENKASDGQPYTNRMKQSRDGNATNGTRQLAGKWPVGETDVTQLCINKSKTSTQLSTLSRSLSHLTTTPETQTHFAYAANTNKIAILDTGAEISAFNANSNTPPTGRSMTTVIQPNGETSTPLGFRQYTVMGIPFTAHIFQPAQIRNPLLSAHDIYS